MEEEIKIKAKKIADDNGLSPLTLIAFVRCGHIKVYDKFEKPIDLAKHKDRFGDTLKTDEERWGEYLRAFEFDDVDLVRNIQMKYESEKAQPLIEAEFEFIKDNYYFEKSGVENIIKRAKIEPTTRYSVEKDANGMYVVKADSAMWEGLSPKIACGNMKNVNVRDEVIAYILSHKMVAKPNQGTIGELITGEIKTNAAHGRWVRRLLKIFEKYYNPF